MIIGKKLYRMTICSNSMEWAKQNLKDAPDGSVFLADKLSVAKGRGNRIWKVYDGQLNVTLLLKPVELRNFSVEDLPIRLSQLNMAISLGIYEAICHPVVSAEALCEGREFISGSKIGIKWPNDFILDGKKVGGILFQLIWHESVPSGIICGFSINVNNKFESSDELFEIATSLSDVSGKKIEMRPFYKNLLSEIDRYYKKWSEGEFDAIYKSWRRVQVYLNKNISVHQKDGTIVSGRMMQVLPNGDMLLIDDKNNQKIISFYMVEQIKD